MGPLSRNKRTIRTAELFAGVGGFRLGLEGYHEAANPSFEMPAAGPFQTVWANQWEPPGTQARQFAARCYEQRFGAGSVVNDDINHVLDLYEAGEMDIPHVDMVVGGFPCQDYSVAKPLAMADGIEGKKGVLWWDIRRFLELKAPRFVLLENVDRLLKSPASQRGRDFAIILSCLANLGYAAEWRVVNSAEYGFPQRRKRVFLYAQKTSKPWNLREQITGGVLASALPVTSPEPDSFHEFPLLADLHEITQNFNAASAFSPFETCGAMHGYHVATCAVQSAYSGSQRHLGEVIVPNELVPAAFFVPEEKLEAWRYLKGNKRVKRVDKKTGFEYFYSEGAMAFPDSLANPARTILTGEGGAAASRFKHIIATSDGRYRRLIPQELERLQGFPAGWTDTGMTDVQRAFCMGNALVVGVVHRIGQKIARRCLKCGRSLP